MTARWLSARVLEDGLDLVVRKLIVLVSLTVMTMVLVMTPRILHSAGKTNLFFSLQCVCFE